MVKQIIGKQTDLGSFTVRRVLPHREVRAVGPFVFFDHIGPAVFKPGQGIDVAPHPHIGLATVTYLFEGAIRHHDSIGSLLEALVDRHPIGVAGHHDVHDIGLARSAVQTLLGHRRARGCKR